MLPKHPIQHIRFDSAHSNDDVAARAHLATDMTEEVLAKLGGKKKERFAEQSHRLAESHGLASEQYLEWLHYQYVAVMLGVREPKGHGASHVISGSTRKPGSHGSDRHD